MSIYTVKTFIFCVLLIKWIPSAVGTVFIPAMQPNPENGHKSSRMIPLAELYPDVADL